MERVFIRKLRVSINALCLKQLLREYHKILTACKIQKERAL